MRECLHRAVPQSSAGRHGCGDGAQAGGPPGYGQAQGASGAWFPLLPAFLGVLPSESGRSAEVWREDRACSPENLYVPEEIKRALNSQPLERGSFLGSASHSINTSTRGQEKGYFGLGRDMKKTFLLTLPFSHPQRAPPQERKKFYVYRGKGGKRFYFPLQ